MFPPVAVPSLHSSEILGSVLKNPAFTLRRAQGERGRRGSVRVVDACCKRELSHRAGTNRMVMNASAAWQLSEQVVGLSYRNLDSADTH